MLEKFKSSLLNNVKIFGLILLIIFTIIVATLSNHQKKLSNNQHVNIIDNIYFKKTLNEIISNLEPKYKNIRISYFNYIYNNSRNDIHSSKKFK